MYQNHASLHKRLFFPTLCGSNFRSVWHYPSHWAVWFHQLFLERALFFLQKKQTLPCGFGIREEGGYLGCTKTRPALFPLLQDIQHIPQYRVRSNSEKEVSLLTAYHS